MNSLLVGYDRRVRGRSQLRSRRARELWHRVDETWWVWRGVIYSCMRNWVNQLSASNSQQTGHISFREAVNQSVSQYLLCPAP